MQAVRLNPEIDRLARADAVGMAEGNITAPREGHGPDGLVRGSRRGRRAGHAWEGSPGTWETSRLPLGQPAGGTGQAEAPGPRGERSAAQGANAERTRGTAERRQRSKAERGARSRSAAVGARTRGNRPEGPRRAKGGTGSRTRP